MTYLDERSALGGLHPGTGGLSNVPSVNRQTACNHLNSCQVVAIGPGRGEMILYVHYRSDLRGLDAEYVILFLISQSSFR